jgi:putative two-component system response regulator
MRRPSLILLDVSLPDYSGMDICRILVSRDETRATPVIFVSIFNDAPTESLAFNAGAADYVSFPVSGPVLLHRVAARLRVAPAEHLAQARSELEQALQTLRSSFNGTVNTLAALLSREGSVPPGYAERCGQISRLVASNLGLAAGAQMDAYYAGLLHRIADAPASGLIPAVQLGPRCAPVREQHTQSAQRVQALLGPIEGLQQAALFLQHAHEWFDGSGAPAGLRGGAIPLGAAAVGGSVLFHELAETSLHGKLRSPGEALDEIRALAGKRFSVDVVNALRRALGQGLGVAAEVLGPPALMPGMVLARDLRHPDGRLLLSEGLALTAAHIDQIVDYGRQQPSRVAVVVRANRSSFSCSNYGASPQNRAG